MGQYCSKRFKQIGPSYTPKNAAEAFALHEARVQKMQSVQPEVVKDVSAMAMFTEYEAQLLLRHVHLEEFEDRLKQFVYKTSLVERTRLS